MSLDADEQAIYEWQLWIDGFGSAAQERLKASTAFVSRIGGVGGTLALYLAAAGVGRLILAHAGSPKPSDFNRQILMTQGDESLRVDQTSRRLRALNPRLVVDTFAENVSAENASRLIAGADVVASCAPRFEERLALNAAAVRAGVPLVDAAMYETELQLVVVRPGVTPCLACLAPEPPAHWRREFPVLGAVAGTVGCLGAMEAIKLLARFGSPLEGMLVADLAVPAFRTVRPARNPACPVCAG